MCVCVCVRMRVFVCVFVCACVCVCLCVPFSHSPLSPDVSLKDTRFAFCIYNPGNHTKGQNGRQNEKGESGPTETVHN